MTCHNDSVKLYKVSKIQTKYTGSQAKSFIIGNLTLSQLLQRCCRF